MCMQHTVVNHVTAHLAMMQQQSSAFLVTKDLSRQQLKKSDRFPAPVDVLTAQF